MQIDREDLEAAKNKGIITDVQANKLWSFWEKEHVDTPSFRFSHVLYYFGGFLAISAITLFVTQAWETLQGWNLFAISTLFFVLGICLTHWFLQRNFRIPAGILATFSLAVIPLAVYNVQVALGYPAPSSYDYSDYHSMVSWYWFPMEIITLLVGAFLLYIYRFPFLIFPVAVTLWYLSMDLVPLIFGLHRYTFQDRALFSMLFGFVVILFAIFMDVKYSTKKQDYAFWLYIFGVLTFWGGLTSQHSDSEVGKFIYCLVNIGMIMVSVFLNRRVFAVFGAIGVLIYLGHLAYSVFKNSLLFPIALVFLGLIIIVAATQWVKAEKRILEYFAPFIPPALLKKRHE